MGETIQPKSTRRGPRVFVNFPVILNVGKKRSHCQAQQLSEHGILVSPKQEVPIGETVQTDLLFAVPNPSLSLFGTVLYAIDRGIGIGFMNMRPDQRSELKRHIEALRVQPKAGQ